VHPADARLHLALGDVFLRMGRQEQRRGADGTTITNFYLDAERQYDAALAADPQSKDAVYGKARVNYEVSGTVAGAKRKAAALVSRCLAMDVSNPSMSMESFSSLITSLTISTGKP